MTNNKYLPTALTFILAMSFPGAASSAERRDFSDVELSDLIQEVQSVGGGARRMSLAWWMPIEFWETILLQNPSLTTEQRQDFLDVLRPYSTLAVVNAKVSKFGALDFLARDQIREQLRIYYEDANGKVRRLVPIEDVDPDVDILLGQMKPGLAAAIGNMGQSFHFFTLGDKNSKGARVMSPYEVGKLTIEIGEYDSPESETHEIEMPLDALFVPRICPNGKPAHISWKVCPWDGSALPQ